MQEKKPPLIVLTGPTSVGKTELSIQLAKGANAEIISADSMQIYKYMDIGTAKVTKEEMSGIKHYLVDELEPDEEFNVVKFKNMAKKSIEQIYKKGKIPLVVGGTGFYIQAILYDIDFADTKENCQYRNELERLASEKGNEYLHQMLMEKDKDAAKTIHPNNVKRVIRALEYAMLTGEKISRHNDQQRIKESPYNFLYFVLNDERNNLYERINKRVDQMIEKGLLEEVKLLSQKGYNKDMVSMQGIGYKEILEYFDEKYSIEEAIYTIKRDTRHFAKRQITWFKREKEVTWLNLFDHHYSKEDILNHMLILLKEKQIIT